MDSKWKTIKAVAVRLVAEPQQLACGASAGKIQVQFRNKSMVPCSLVVDGLPVADMNVAKSSMTSNATRIHIPRGEVKAVFLKPHDGERQIGSWMPVAVGITTLFGTIRIEDRLQISFGSAEPEVKLRVIP